MCNRSDCMQFEHWYGDAFGCRRLVSVWADAWIALRNGLLSLGLLIGWSGTVCMATRCVGSGTEGFARAALGARQC
jgi:hypothetical protein